LQSECRRAGYRFKPPAWLLDFKEVRAQSLNMENCFSRKAQKRLEKMYQTRVLLALDYDGTLSPIVPHIGEAKIPASTLQLLKKVSERHPVAIVSGRSFKDLASRMQIKAIVLVGSHGFDWGTRSKEHKRFSILTRRWKKAMAALSKDFPGMVIEDKKISLSIHYRNVPRERRREFVRLFKSIKNDIRQYRCVGGQYVFNLVPEGVPNKGGAVRMLMKKLKCNRAIFVGDDVTDEDVFKLRPKSRIFDVRIGKNPESKATYYMSRQADMDRFLKLLLRHECG